MLRTKRKIGASVQIGPGVNITIIDVKDNEVEIGIIAPGETRIQREHEPNLMQPLLAAENIHTDLQKKATENKMLTTITASAIIFFAAITVARGQ